MQTVIKTSPITQREPAQKPVRRGNHGKSNVIWLAIAFCVYLYFAWQMQGISFDTAFLAFYCAALTAFIGKAFLIAIHPDSAE